MKFKDWVREQRTTRRLSVSECAKRADVKQPVWSQWEHEESEPRKDTVRKIAFALDIEVEAAMSAAFPEARQTAFGDLLESIPERETVPVPFTLEDKKRLMRLEELLMGLAESRKSA